MILKSRLIFLQKRQADVLPNVLMGQDLQEEIKCDYKYQLIKGPFANTGQKQFIEMFLYNDSSDMDYYLYR